MEDLAEEERLKKMATKNSGSDNVLRDKDYNEDEVESYYDPDFDKEWDTLGEEQYNESLDPGIPDINNPNEWEEV